MNIKQTYLEKKVIKSYIQELAPVVHTCNPSHSGDRLETNQGK
jgi:hypothetical protein